MISIIYQSLLKLKKYIQKKSTRNFTSSLLKEEQKSNEMVDIDNVSGAVSTHIDMFRKAPEELLRVIDITINMYMVHGLDISPEKLATVRKDAANDFLRRYSASKSNDFTLRNFFSRDLFLRDLSSIDSSLKKSKIPMDDVLLNSYAYLNGYTYSDGLTLKNKYELRGIDFQERCARDIIQASFNLKEEPLPEKFDSSYLKYLHKRLFENTFEWAGCTRELPFTFSDGTVEMNSTLKIPDLKCSISSDKVKSGLEEIDRILAEKNSLKGLSREEFVREASTIFSHFYNIYPFRSGNGCVQRIFFEKMAEAAGHRLDFSVITNQRWKYVRHAALSFDKNDVITIRNLFEDISNPEKVNILKEFIQHKNDIKDVEIGNKLIAVAKEGSTYMGLYKGCSRDSIMLLVNDQYVLCKKDYLAPETVKTLQLGDRITFTVPTSKKNVENVLIPDERVASLTEEEIISKIAENGSVQRAMQRIRSLSKCVYGSSEMLDKDINLIHVDSGLGEQHIEQHVSLFKYKFAGMTILGVDSPARKRARINYCKLEQALDDYINTVIFTRERILQRHQEKHERCQRKIKMPSQVRNILFLSEEDQIKALNANPSLHEEIKDLTNQVRERLTPWEYQALDKEQYDKLADSIGISVSRAREVTAIIKQAHKVCQLTRNRAHDSKTMSIVY
ncbi:BID domain-containing T4SS effector [Bartonella bilalgolemii]|uniref:protein adenylyltransferase n=1 Tax=Bartonella bilalgolemii TaxID=2942911 RepID=A0ABT0P9J6_9HYPH|nr:BID domain-containing T4SS effector [Bartonella sp. G70]MCL6229827.1 BID domain-containing T4SS effector [Bartonella sp. G70]